MRKRMKVKRRSCKLCKPFKMGWANRWKNKELKKMEIDEKEIRKAVKGEDDG